jgi:hypothetical protein
MEDRVIEATDVVAVIDVAENPPASAEKTSPKFTFAAILALIEDADEGMETPVDLAELGELVRDKIDAIKLVDDRLKAHAKLLDERIDQIAKARDAVLANRQRLLAYVARQMQERGFKKVPGVQWRAQLVPASQAKLILSRDASARDFIDCPALVEQERVYRWNKEALRQKLDAGEKVEFARLERSSHVRFFTNKEA